MNLGSLDKKTIKICAFTTVALTAIAVALRTFCLAFFYDYLSEGVGYYTNSALPKILYAVCVLSVIFFAVVAFISKKGLVCFDSKEENAPLKIVSACVMFGFLSFFVGMINSTEFVNVSVVLDLLIKISSLMAIIYFAMNIFGSESVRPAQVVLGFGIIVWLVSILAITYFNIYVPMNSPDKTHLHLALISLMLFLVCEFRRFLVKINKPIYIFSLFAAVFFSGLETVPSIIKYFALGMADYDYLNYDIVILMLFLYTAVRLVSFALCEVADAEEELPPVANPDETEKEL